jgi:hypothetical protein
LLAHRPWIDISPISTHYPDSELTSLCSFSLSGEITNTRFDPIGTRTNDLPHTRRDSPRKCFVDISILLSWLIVGVLRHFNLQLRLHLWYLRMLPKDNIILQNMFCFLFLSQLMWLFCFCYCFWFGLFCFVLFCVVIQREFDKVFLVYLISDSYINYLSNIFTMSMLRTWWMIPCLIDCWCFTPLSAIFQLYPFLLFTKLGANPHHIGDRLVWVVR